jgi:hypothetical protein
MTTLFFRDLRPLHMPTGSLGTLATIAGLGASVLGSGLLAQSVVALNGEVLGDWVKTLGAGGILAWVLWAVLRTVWSAFEKMVNANQAQLDVMREALDLKDTRIAQLVDAHAQTMREHNQQTVEQLSALASGRVEATLVQKENTRATAEQTQAVKMLSDEIRQQSRICRFERSEPRA